jgi:hypothetical protein
MISRLDSVDKKISRSRDIFVQIYIAVAGIFLSCDKIMHSMLQQTAYVQHMSGHCSLCLTFLIPFVPYS